MAASVSARDRAGQIIRRPRLLLLLVTCAALVVVSVTAVGASAAYFTASSNNGGTVTAGAVQLSLAPAEEIVDLSNLAPGVSRSGTIGVTNTMNEAAVTLGIADLQMAPPSAGLDEILDVQVRETAPGDQVRFSGKLGNLHGAAVGTLGAGASATFVITVSWPADQDDPSRQNATADFVFEWTAAST